MSKQYTIHSICAAIAVCLTGMNVQADIINADRDTLLFSDNTDRAFESTFTQISSARYSLYHIDLSSLSTPVTSAVLNLRYEGNVNDPTERTVTANYLLYTESNYSWTEGNGDPAPSGTATFGEQGQGTTSWQDLGSNNVANLSAAFGGSTLGTLGYTFSNSAAWVQVPLDVATVETYRNTYGAISIAVNVPVMGSTPSITSSEAGSNNPFLDAGVSAIPEPSTAMLILLGMGGLAFMRRRRR